MPNNPLTYLDYNATSPVLPEVRDAMLPLLGKALNPSSVHASGREARALIETARRRVLALVNAQGSELVFTATGTEANNLAIKSVNRPRILASAIEHPSVLNNKEITNRIPVDENGVVSLEALEKLLKLSTEKTLISVMLANNETGVIQPIRAIAALAKQYGALVHTDAIQAVSKIEVDFDALGVDFMSISAHKIGGTQGAAALVMRKGIDITAQMIGGGQEKRRRAGTENVTAIHGFGLAAQKAAENLENYRSQTHLLIKGLEESVAKIAPDAVIFGQKVARLPNTSYIALPNVDGNTQLIRFDMENIAVSAGSACSSGKVSLSHVLQAMGVAEKTAKCAVRVSIGAGTTEEEIEQFLNVFATLYETGNKTETVAHAA